MPVNTQIKTQLEKKNVLKMLSKKVKIAQLANTRLAVR